MLFQRQFERLYFAVERIANQLEYADPEQRAYLVEELTALREMGSQFFDLWVGFEDLVQELVDDYGGPETAVHAAPRILQTIPSASPELSETFRTTPTDGVPVDGPANPPRGSASPGTRPISAHELHAFAVAANGLHGQTHLPLEETGQPAQLFRKGMGYFDLFMFRESQATFERMVQIDPDFTAARLYLALSQLANREWEAAERQLTLVEVTAVEELLAVAAREAKAHMYAERGLYTDALRELRRVLADKPEYVDAHVNAAVCAYVVQDFAAAASHASRATELTPGDAQAWRLLGASLYARGQFEKAWQAYREAASLSPGNADILTESGHAALAADKQDAAQAQFSRAYALAGQDGRALSGLARVAAHRGDHDTAIALLKKGATLCRDQPAPLTELGWALCAGGRLRDAERIFRSLEETGHGDRMTRSGLARIAALQGDLDGARSMLRDLLTAETAQDRAHALTELARIEASCGRIRSALRYLRAALRIDGSHRDALICLGTVLARAGLTDSGDVPDTETIPMNGE